MSLTIYVDTDAEAATFAPGLLVESIQIRNERNRVGLVEGYGHVSNRLFVSIGSYILAPTQPEFPIQIRFNLYDALAPTDAWVDDIASMFKRLLHREDVRGGFVQYDHQDLAQWRANEAWVADEGGLDFGVAEEVALRIRAGFEQANVQLLSKPLAR